MLIFGGICLFYSLNIYKKNRNNVLNNYLVWFFSAIFLFCWSRSVGHIMQHVFYFMGYKAIWKKIEPFSGSLNSMTFFIIAGVTLFFYKMKKITDEMERDKEKIIKKTQEVFKLNTTIEQIVSERTRTELALRVAHEIRNPITIIGGLIKRLSKDKSIQSLPDELKTKFDKVLEQVTNLDKLVMKFEGLRKKESEPQFVICEMNTIVQEVIEVVNSEANEKGIMIYLNISPMNLNFHCNRQLIKLIILHIIRNSLDFCKRGDIIDIETGKKKDGVWIKIADNGPGIPDEILSTIFEPFARIESGTSGLELPIIKQIVEEHRGEIKLESKLGLGTTIEMIFPVLLEESKNIGK